MEQRTSTDSLLDIADDDIYSITVRQTITNPAILAENSNITLDMAYKDNNFSVLKQLIESGAAIGNLLLKAIEADQSELICYLLISSRQSIDPNISDLTGQTALMLAIQKNQLETISLLAKHPKINISQVDSQGNTALHHAAQLGNNAVIKLLMKQPVSIKDKNHDQKTPVQLARENGHTELAHWMEEKHRYKKVKPFLKPLQAKLQEQVDENQRLREELNTYVMTQKSWIEKFSLFSNSKSLMAVAEKDQREEREQQEKQIRMQNLLIEALLKGDIEAVKKQEAQGASLLYPNADGLYPLAAAVYSTRLELARYVEVKLKDNAAKQWREVDYKTAIEKINAELPPLLPATTRYCDIGEFYMKNHGKKWKTDYDKACLLEETCNRWVEDSWEKRSEIITKVVGNPTNAKWSSHVWLERNEAPWKGRMICGGMRWPARKIHDFVINGIIAQMDTLKNEIEAKVKLPSVGFQLK